MEPSGDHNTNRTGPGGVEIKAIAAADAQRIFLRTADGSLAVRACSGTTVHPFPFPRMRGASWGSGPARNGGRPFWSSLNLSLNV